MKPKMAGKGSNTRRDAPGKRLERKKRKLADSFHGPLAQEGGEAEDDFGAVAVLDLAEEAALVADGGSAQGEFLTGQPGEGQGAEPQKRKKRKIEQVNESTAPQAKSQDGQVNAASKKSKKKRKESDGRDVASDEKVVEKHAASKKGGKEMSELPKENPRALPLPEAGADHTEQADWFGGCFRAHFGGALSSLEQADITDQHIASGSHSGAPLAPQLKVLFGSRWQERLLGSTLEEGHEAGSPTVLIVAASAKRCVEIIKTLTELNAGCRVAKLFAKHFKIEEQIEVLKKRVNVAAGTPNRLLKLTELSALSLSSLEVLVLDLHKDAKGLTVVDIPETRNDFWNFYQRHGSNRISKGECKLFFNL
ncbi:hypothetical protein KFL_007560020 [Klebsormidium nitens]|uniref:Protein CMSS1 n=1 Tax=Klebsormidium nitens TaxID=105231 RepID=A0A1Y1IKH3_KLENI|nr:hypothetical protein KFL_007560020 [Klebsormidium nitens]|eukprot:GAQ91274.1 hypothetical protein KFL_007560020 [Klebsormidium nitens]